MSVLNQDSLSRGLAPSQNYIGEDDEFDMHSGFERRAEPAQPSGPYANDDDPRFSSHWRNQSGRIEPLPGRRDIGFGVVIGVSTAILISLISFFVPSTTGAAGAPVSLVTIFVPSIILGLLSIVMSRLNRLSISIEKTARKIEIAQNAIAELDNVRTTFQNEVAFVNQALQINRNFISTRLNTIKADFEGAALSSARILEGRISEIAHNFKESVLHDTSIQGNWNVIISATEKIIDMLHDTPKQLDRNIQDRTAALQSVVENQINQMASQFEQMGAELARSQNGVQHHMNDAIEKIRDHVATVQKAMGSAVEANSDEQARKYEMVLQELRSIGNEMSVMTKSIPEQLTIDIKATEKAIESVVDKAMRTANSRLDETITSATRSNAALSETLSTLPAKIDDYMTSIAPSIAAGINENARRSETRIIEVVKRSVVEGQAQSAHFGPTLDKIAREILEIENRLRSALDDNRHDVEGLVQKLPDALKMQIDSIMRDKLENVATDLKTTISSLVERQDTNSNIVKDNLQRVLDAVHLTTETVKETVTSMAGSVQNIDGKMMSVSDAVKDVHGSLGSVNSAVQDINGAIQSVSGSVHDMHKVIQTVGSSMTDIHGAIHTVGGTLNDADHVIAAVNAVTAQFRDLIDTRMDVVRQSVEAAISQFDNAIVRQRDAMTDSMTSDLAQKLSSTQNKLALEYQSIEERLTRSLSNFNEIVQNCIASLEDSVTWRRDTFDEQIKVTTEQNLANVQSEIELLTQRLQSRVLEANIQGHEFEARATQLVDTLQDIQASTANPTLSSRTLDIVDDAPADTDGPDPELIENLTKKLANIDTILGELRREGAPPYEDA